ncbi:MAG: hypothetical protein JWO92_2462 [Chitinophagaceae bacterium]|nr:hypothetical protein [Chitinophagaceae bacterium]
MKKILAGISVFIGVHTLHAQENVNRETKPPLNKWSVTNNYSKSDNGQLIINLPVQAVMLCTVNRTGEAKTFTLHNGTPKELTPGNYDITFWGIKIPSLIVEKAKDTRILAGVLNSTVKGLWEIWTADGIKIYSAGGPKQVALPVGSYIVKTKGAEIKTTITDGKVSIFSFTSY